MINKNRNRKHVIASMGGDFLIKIGIMNKGDEVLTVTQEFIAVRRKNGEVDLVKIVCEENGWRVDEKNMIRIGYGNNTVTAKTDEDVSIVNF